MKLHRLLAVSRKEFIHIFRDPRSFILSLIIPVIMLLLFGYALSLDVKYIPMAVIDRDHSPASRAYIESFASSEYFIDLGRVDSYRQLERLIDSNKALVGLVIPPGFQEALARGRNVQVQALVDASDSMTASIALSYIRLLNQLYSQKEITEKIKRLGGDELKMPVAAEARIWFNEDLESRNFIIPGLIAVIMAIIAALLTSLTVAREWEQGSMESLISTPIRSQELMIGKLVPYFVIGMLDVTIAVLMGEFLFHVPLKGSVTLLFTSSALFLLGMLSMGLLISVAAKNQALAFQIGIISTFLPVFLLSGFVFPISSMPKVIQLITYLIPARYFVTILKGIYLKGVGLEVLVVDFILIVIFAVAFFSIAANRFKKKLG
jgi:ABC-2 type transport system permease protein